jgi:hypothetical protein
MAKFARTLATAFLLAASMGVASAATPFSDYFLSWRKSLLVNNSSKDYTLQMITPTEPANTSGASPDTVEGKMLKTLSAAGIDLPCLGNLLVVNPEDDLVIAILSSVGDSFKIPAGTMVGIVTMPTFKFVRIGMRLSQGLGASDKMEMCIQGTSVFTAALKHVASKTGKTEAYDTAKTFVGGKLQASPKNPEKTKFKVYTSAKKIQWVEKNFENMDGGAAWTIED